MEQEEPKAFDYIDGFAIHYYGNFAPASILTAIQNNYPDKILLSTEACEGIPAALTLSVINLAVSIPNNKIFKFNHRCFIGIIYKMVLRKIQNSAQHGR